MASANQIPLSEYLITSYRPDCDYIDGEVKDRTLGTRAHRTRHAHPHRPL